MKAKIQLDIRNPRAFNGSSFNPKAGESSYFSVFPGENVEKTLEQNGLSEEEVAEICMRLLKGTKDQVELETEAEEKVLKEVQEDKEAEKVRKSEIEKLNKKEQITLLKELGHKGKIPVYEKGGDGRIALIYKLEQV